MVGHTSAGSFLFSSLQKHTACGVTPSSLANADGPPTIEIARLIAVMRHILHLSKSFINDCLCTIVENNL